MFICVTVRIMEQFRAGIAGKVNLHGNDEVFTEVFKWVAELKDIPAGGGEGVISFMNELHVLDKSGECLQR